MCQLGCLLDKLKKKIKHLEFVNVTYFYKMMVI